MTSNSNSRYILRRIGNPCPHRTYTWMFVAALFITAKVKIPKRPSFGK